jgi:hypothetical protein
MLEENRDALAQGLFNDLHKVRRDGPSSANVSLHPQHFPLIFILNFSHVSDYEIGFPLCKGVKSLQQLPSGLYLNFGNLKLD